MWPNSSHCETCMTLRRSSELRRSDDWQTPCKICHLTKQLFNPKPGGYINWHCRAAGSRIWLLRRPIGEEEVIRHATAVVGSSDIYIIYIYIPLGAPTIGGGSAQPGSGGGGSERSQISLQSILNMWKRCKNRRFPTFIDLKSTKNAVLYLKVPNKIYSQDVFWGIN